MNKLSWHCYTPYWIFLWNSSWIYSEISFEISSYISSKISSIISSKIYHSRYPPRMYTSDFLLEYCSSKLSITYPNPVLILSHSNPNPVPILSQSYPRHTPRISSPYNIWNLWYNPFARRFGGWVWLGGDGWSRWILMYPLGIPYGDLLSASCGN